MNILKKVIKAILAVLIIIIIVVLVYAAYVFISYNRIDDNKKLKINEPKVKSENISDKVNTNVEYTIGTYNVGFGAYLPDYSFFMDGGKYSRCYSKESSTDAIKGAASLSNGYNPDFMMFEEVDRKSTRSYGVNQENIITDIFDDYYSSFAVNYNSAYLFYPFYKPIGKSYSGIVLYSKFKITDSLRRSLPISTGFSKFLDLDRCYSISRINVENGKELVLFTVHLSAYGNSDEIREGKNYQW